MKNISLAIGFMALLSLTAGNVHAQNPQEAAKIRYLILSVEALKGAKFLRNGREYDAKAAADHLRLKLKTAGNRVKTADDFIRLCGSRSSLTGQAYRIRFADGTAMEAAVFFRNKLKSFAADKP
jgi:hypothetical protein